MMQGAAIVVQPEQQRSHGVLSALVPTKARNDAVRRARVLDLDHCALAGLVGTVCRFRDHAVQTGAFEVLEPLSCKRAIARHRGQIHRRLDSGQQLFQQRSTLALR